MEEKEKTIYKKKNILLSIPFEIDRRYRDEAKKREINISDLLERLIEERDYFEKKLVEKDRIIENGTEIIHKSIVESLSEIKNTNLQLKVVSSSLSSIPQVTEAARNINDRCTKSAEVIGNFNVVVSNVNKEIKNTEESIKAYNDVIQANKSQITQVNSDLSQVRANTNKFLTEVKQVVDNQKNSVIEKFTSELNTTTKKLIDSVKINIFDLNYMFNSKIKIAFGVCVFLMFIMSFMFVYGYFNNISKLNDSVYNLQKNNVFLTNQNNNYHDIVCKYRPPVPGINYKTFCNSDQNGD